MKEGNARTIGRDSDDSKKGEKSDCGSKGANRKDRKDGKLGRRVNKGTLGAGVWWASMVQKVKQKESSQWRA